jgi:hypothetical protein
MTPTFSLTRNAIHTRTDDPERVVAQFAATVTKVDGTPYSEQLTCPHHGTRRQDLALDRVRQSRTN